MESRIEQTITEIEEFIDGCKFKPLSSTVILVNKEEIEELLRDLRNRIPEEINHCRKILTNKQAILDDAKQKAEDMIQKTAIQSNELINEHEIMQQAYAKANEIVTMAVNEAQKRLDEAVLEANAYKQQAIQYTDDTLASMEQILEGAMNDANQHYSSLIASLNEYNEVIKANRSQLYPVMEDLNAEVELAENANAQEQAYTETVEE